MAPRYASLAIPLLLSYTTFTLSYWQESLESAAEGVGWSWGVMGVQTSAGGATGLSIPAVLVVGTAQIRMRLRICPVGCNFSAFCASLAVYHARI